MRPISIRTHIVGVSNTKMRFEITVSELSKRVVPKWSNAPAGRGCSGTLVHKKGSTSLTSLHTLWSVVHYQGEASSLLPDFRYTTPFENNANILLLLDCSNNGTSTDVVDPSCAQHALSTFPHYYTIQTVYYSPRLPPEMLIYFMLRRFPRAR